MDKFHNSFGTLTTEAQEIISDLVISIRPILEKYKDDIETLIFLREAITFLSSDISEYVLRYAMNQHKKLEKEKEND